MCVRVCVFQWTTNSGLTLVLEIHTELSVQLAALRGKKEEIRPTGLISAVSAGCLTELNHVTDLC